MALPQLEAPVPAAGVDPAQASLQSPDPAALPLTASTALAAVPEVAVPAGSAADSDRIVLADADRIDPSRLTEIRAGADVGSGLSVAFAIERTISIDGQVLAATTFKWSNVPSADGISASVTTALAAGGLPVTSSSGASAAGVAQVVVPLPSGAAISVGANPASPASTAVTLINVPNNLMPVQVVQNSANNRLIQSSTVVSVSTSSFTQALGNRVLESLNTGLVRGIR
ncbi:hypothetical protein [Jeongeupia chitinilytica]|nr:hypothetical protein [Jeongeupia chitinilytica]